MFTDALFVHKTVGFYRTLAPRARLHASGPASRGTGR